MKGGFEDIDEAIRVNCWHGDTRHFRDLLFAGVAARCGHYESEITAHLRRDATFLVSSFEKQLPGSRFANQQWLDFRRAEDSFVIHPASDLYRKFILISNYLSILSIFETVSRPGKFAR